MSGMPAKLGTPAKLASPAAFMASVQANRSSMAGRRYVATEETRQRHMVAAPVCPRYVPQRPRPINADGSPVPATGQELNWSINCQFWQCWRARPCNRCWRTSEGLPEVYQVPWHERQMQDKQYQAMLDDQTSTYFHESREAQRVEWWVDAVVAGGAVGPSAPGTGTPAWDPSEEISCPPAHNTGNNPYIDMWDKLPEDFRFLLCGVGPAWFAAYHVVRGVMDVDLKMTREEKVVWARDILASVFPVAGEK